MKIILKIQLKSCIKIIPQSLVKQTNICIYVKKMYYPGPSRHSSYWNWHLSPWQSGTQQQTLVSSSDKHRASFSQGLAGHIDNTMSQSFPVKPAIIHGKLLSQYSHFSSIVIICQLTNRCYSKNSINHLNITFITMKQLLKTIKHYLNKYLL